MPSSPATTAEAAAVALDGRPLGKRGAATRRRLLDATARLLESHGVRDLRVVDIAREVGTSPATFYQYFRDVEEAVLALTAEVGEELAPVDELLRRPWTGPTGLDAARDDGRRVPPVLGRAPRGAPHPQPRRAGRRQRFRQVRNNSLRPITEHLAADRRRVAGRRVA